MGVLILDQVELVSQAFVRAHGLPLPRVHDRWEVDDELASGGFGTIHHARPAGAASGVLLKLYEPTLLADSLGGFEGLADRLVEVAEAFDTADPRWPRAVMGMPYCVVRGSLDGAPRVGAFMLDLAALGYAPLDLSTTGELRYRRRDVRQRIRLATSFAQKAALFETARFLHADVNPENVLVRYRDHDVQVIDFDSGAVVSKDRRPATEGKRDECVPPEVRGGRNRRPAPYSLTAERWSIGTVVGWLVLGHHPVAYLRAISPRVVEMYADDPQGWPYVSDRALLSDDPRRRRSYDAFVKSLDRLPDGFRSMMRQFFAAGLNGAGRPTAAAWVAALSELREPPRFELVAVDEVVVEGGEATLRWVAKNATHVEVEGVSAQASTGSVTVLVDRSRSFELTAVNAFGATPTRTPLVRVVPYPVLDVVRLPAPPPLRLGLSVAFPLAPRLPAAARAPGMRVDAIRDAARMPSPTEVALATRIPSPHVVPAPAGAALRGPANLLRAAPALPARPKRRLHR